MDAPKLTKIEAMTRMLPDIEQMQRDGWRWADMSRTVRDRLGQQGMSDGALRALLCRARRRNAMIKT